MGPEGVETATSDLGDKETHSGKITDGVTGTTETGDEDLVVLVNEGHATITGNEAGDSLIVFFELDSDTLSDTGVGLLSLNADLLDDDAAGVGGTLERLSPLGGLVSLLVALVSPSVVSSLDREFTTGINSTWFVASHIVILLRYEIYLLITSLTSTPYLYFYPQTPLII